MATIAENTSLRTLALDVLFKADVLNGATDRTFDVAYAAKTEAEDAFLKALRQETGIEPALWSRLSSVVL